MSHDPRRLAITATIAAVIGGVLIDELTTERASTPSLVALAWAVVLSVTAVAGWCWWQGKRWRHTVRATVPAARAVAMATSAVLAIRIGEWWWLGSYGASELTASGAVASTVSALLLACVARPLAEEALLRGYLLTHLRAVSTERNTIASVALVSALIGASVEGTFTHVASNAVLAALLALIVLRTNRLWLAALTHVLIALLGEAARQQIGLAALSPTLVLIALPLVVGGAVFALWRVLRETQWVEPPHSHRGVAPPATWSLNLPR